MITCGRLSPQWFSLEETCKCFAVGMDPGFANRNILPDVLAVQKEGIIRSSLPPRALEASQSNLLVLGLAALATIGCKKLLFC